MKNLIGLKVSQVFSAQEDGLTAIILEDGTMIVFFTNGVFTPIQGVSTPELPSKKVEVTADSKIAPKKEEEPAPKKEEEPAPKKEEEFEDEEDGEDDFWTSEEIDELDREGLEEVIEDEELDLDPEEFKSVRALKKAVKAELGI